jgi:Na+/proline symporter
MVLEWEDWVVIAVYFVIVLGTGLGISFLGKKGSGQATDFLLAGRSMSFLPVIFSK